MAGTSLRKAEIYVKKQGVVYLIGIVLIMLALFSCDDHDCPNCPEPKEPDYELLYSYVGQYPDTYVLTYSSKSGEILDSALYQGNPFDNVVFSHDGEYACYTSNYDLELGASETWVTHWATRDTIAYRSGIGALAAYLSTDDQYLLLTGGNIVAILSFPDLATLYLDSVSSGAGAFHPSRKIAYVSLERARDSIYVIDFSQETPPIRSFPLHNADGTKLLSQGPFMCTNTSLVLNAAIPKVVTYLQFYDTNDFGLRNELVARNYVGLGRHPDSTRVFLSYLTFIGNFPVSGGIDLYNIETNTLQPWIAEGKLDSGTGEPFVPSQIEVLPDGSSMFVLSGGNGFWLGPILQLNTATKEVMKRFDNTDGFSRLIRLNPKNVAE